MTKRDRRELRRLNPALSDEELEEAYETLTRYANLVVRMVERRHNERKRANGRNGVKWRPSSSPLEAIDNGLADPN